MYKSDIEKIKINHDTAVAFISLFFAGFDLVYFLIILVLFGCDQYIFKNNQKFFLVLLLDIGVRIINLSITSLAYSFLKEIFFTLFSTFQFYLIISFLNHIFTQTNFVYPLENAKIKNTFLTIAFFFVFSIVLDFSIIISIIQSISAMAAILIYSYHVRGKVVLFLINVKNKNPYFNGQDFISHFIVFLTIYCIFYCILRMISLFVKNILYSFYMEMACEIFKEVSKYLSFGIVIALYYLFNKYIRGDDYVRI